MQPTGNPADEIRVYRGSLNQGTKDFKSQSDLVAISISSHLFFLNTVSYPSQIMNPKFNRGLTLVRYNTLLTATLERRLYIVLG